MKKQLYIAEKPSVAQEFAKALKLKTRRADGYLESDEAVITWCVGHLVTMSYPEEYDPALKKWSLQTLPFIPSEFKYEVIPSVAKQFQIVSSLLNREDVDTIYVCTDSGREGEYIYRLVEQKAQVSGKKRLRVWIDSQTEEEILRGIREAKDLSEYDNLSASAYLRAKEDYLMGINFSRLLTLKYGNSISNYLNTKYSVISVGRVMTCVLGMVVRREREIREFVKTPFYRVISTIDASGHSFEGEWRAVKGSRYFESFDLYKENGFKTEEKAKELIAYLLEEKPIQCIVESVEKKKEKKNPPLLYNLAELQNDCSKRFKISPDEALRVVQELYEKKLVTYPRTDARVFPPISKVTAASFFFVSVVMIAFAASVPFSLLLFFASASILIPDFTRSIGSCIPITPVEPTSTLSASTPRTQAASFAVSSQYFIPSSPVHAFAMPEFTITACGFRFDSTIARSHFTGAAFTRFVVKVPAALHGFSL